MTEVFPQNE